jgi:hypothetical protein
MQTKYRSTTSFGGLALAALGAVLGCGEVPPGVMEDWEVVTSPITGGTLVPNNLTPYDSVFKLESPAGSLGTATKIGSRRFLTCAHCLPGGTVGATVRLSNTLAGNFTGTATLTAVAKHPSWLYQRAGKDFYDVAVFEINADTPGAALAMRTDFVPVGRVMRMVGFGCNVTNPGDLGKKQMVDITAELWGSPDIDVHNVTNSIVGSDPLRYGCEGDSGGPWLSEIGTWGIAAVSSRGNSNGTLAARHSSVLRWINAPAINVFAPGEDGTLFNFASALCAGVQGSSTASGAQIQQFYCDGRNQPNDTQSWRLLGLGSGQFAFVNRNGSRCLGVDGASSADGALLKQFTCAAALNSNQAWTFVHTSGDFYQVRNANSGKCMSVNAGSPNPGANLAQFTCGAIGSLTNQSWIFTR